MKLLQMKRTDPNGRRKGNVWASITVAALVRLAAAMNGEAHAQSAALQEKSFEVVSVKLNTSGGLGSMMGVQPGGRFVATNLPVRQVIVRAFGIQSFQLTGDPDWLRTERYDIQAKAPDGAVVMGDAIDVMLQAMLADRFKLKVRRQTRESPVYELVLARGDRRFGEHLHQTSPDCVATRDRGTSPGGPAAASPLIGPSDQVPCGAIMNGGNRIASGGYPLAVLATMLGPRVQRIVVDKTGLNGLYDFDLQFLPDPLAGSAADGPVRVFLVGTDVPPLMTAIQEQLGLKLQPALGPVESVVIESIERPSPD